MKFYKINKLMLLAIFVTLFISSCNDSPTQVGMEFIDEKATISVVSDSLISKNSFVNSQQNTGGILVGEAKNMRAASLIRFDIPQKMDTITEDKIISCKLVIVPRRYALGDTLANILNFEIKEVTSRWTLETTTDEVFADNLYINSRQIADTSVNFSRKDTMDAMTFDFPKSLCAEWLKKNNDVTNITDTVWGMAILPKAGSTIINEFAAYSTYDTAKSSMKIQVIYNKNDENGEKTLDTLEIYSMLDKKFIEFNDEIVEENIEENIIIQGSVRLHSNLQFALSQIPDLAIIHKAELVLTMDEAKSYAGNKPLSENLQLLFYSNLENLDEEPPNQTPAYTMSGTFDSTKKTFTFNVHVPFNDIAQAKEKKGALFLSFNNVSADELNYLNRYVFYGMKEADTTKRPKLNIIYSKM
jgi:hypothetical protein